jgi:hypothetical protein
MAHKLDLTLPTTAPAAYLSQTAATGDLPIAVYTLLPLSEDELHEVARACEPDPDLEEDEDAVVRTAPEPYFIAQPLRAVYDIHLQRSLQGDTDPTFFIVVVDEDWRKNGVLLVTLENDDEPPTIDSFMCEAECVGVTLLNLQVANMGWTDLRESFEVGVNHGENREGEDDDGEEKEELPTHAE